MTNTTRITAIQQYANDHGYALALPNKSSGLHIIGYPLAGTQQSKLLDNAANTVIELIEG